MAKEDSHRYIYCEASTLRSFFAVSRWIFSRKINFNRKSRFLILSRFLRSEHFCNYQFPTVPQSGCLNIDSQLEFILYKSVLETKFLTLPPLLEFIPSPLYPAQFRVLHFHQFSFSSASVFYRHSYTYLVRIQKLLTNLSDFYSIFVEACLFLIHA